ncbi:MAG TPA: hypothetical protein VGB06_01020 [Solirubrobacterales bacterium]|jgi:hypothetical protein
MRKMLMTAVLAGATMLAPGVPPQARASHHDWFAIGTIFRIGAAHIAFAFGRPSFAYEPAYYYRYDQPIHYGGHQCSRYCFRDAGYYYHHESCPLVAAHFAHYQVDPYWAFDRYAPRYSGYGGGYGYRDYGYSDRYRYDDRYGYDRYDDRYDRGSRYRRDDSYRRYDHDRYGRYDRRDRYDRHDRYDRDRGHRGRGRGHRHYKGCGHY